jgi:hypothetical protein
VEQFNLHDAFEHLNMPGQRRLGHVEPCGRAPEMQFLGHRHKAAQLNQFEHARTLFLPQSLILCRHHSRGTAPWQGARLQ